MEIDVQRLIGALEAQGRATEKAVGLLRDEVHVVRGELTTMNKKLAEIEGGKKMLWGLLAAAGGLGAAIAALLGPFIKQVGG